MQQVDSLQSPQQPTKTKINNRNPKAVVSIAGIAVPKLLMTSSLFDTNTIYVEKPP